MTETENTSAPSTPATPSGDAESRRHRCRHKGRKFVIGLLAVAAIAFGVGYAGHVHAERAHHGWGPGWGGDRDCGPAKASADSPLTQDAVKKMIDRRLARWGNDNLAVGPITETDTAISGSIVTKKEGALVQSFTFDKLTGRPASAK